MNKKQKQIKKRKKEFEKLGIKPVISEIKKDELDLENIYIAKQDVLEAFLLKEKELKTKRKLYFQCVLQPFGMNARNAMMNYDWTKLSKTIRTQKNFICEYCGESHPEKWGTECHEEWNYELVLGQKKIILKLKELKCVCKKCHETVHFLRSVSVADKEYTDELINRYALINKISNEEALKDKKIFMTAYRIRTMYNHINNLTWELDSDILNQIESMYGMKCRPKAETINFS